MIFIIKEILDHWRFYNFFGHTVERRRKKRLILVLVTSLTLNIFMIKSSFLETKVESCISKINLEKMFTNYRNLEMPFFRRFIFRAT